LRLPGHPGLRLQRDARSYARDRHPVRGDQPDRGYRLPVSRPQNPVRMIDQAAAVGRGRPARPAKGRLRRAAQTVEAFISESRLNALGVAIVALVLLVALFGPLIAPQNPNQINLIAILQHPSVHHWFGTDDVGRDLFSRVIVGCRISIEAAIIILSLSVTFGTALGILSGLA